MTNIRNRPYMVVTYTYQLKPGQKSHSKGFMNSAEWDAVENMTIVDRVSNNQMVRAELVLDLLNQKVVKCRDGDIADQEIFDIFVKRHYEKVKQALGLWIAKNPEHLKEVRALIAEDDAKEANQENLNA